MHLFRRPAAAAPSPALGPPGVDHLDPVAAHALMLRVAAEAVLAQDEAEAVLASIRAHVPLGYTAGRAGPLVRRFFGLRDQLPDHLDDDGQEGVRAALSAILHHHAELLSLAMELSAVEWRSDRLREQVEGLHLGRPGERLETIWSTLAGAAAYARAEPA